jgi:hypothetical protein
MVLLRHGHVVVLDRKGGPCVLVVLVIQPCITER